MIGRGFIFYGSLSWFASRGRFTGASARCALRPRRGVEVKGVSCRPRSPGVDRKGVDAATSDQRVEAIINEAMPGHPGERPWKRSLTMRTVKWLPSCAPACPTWRWLSSSTSSAVGAKRGTQRRLDVGGGDAHPGLDLGRQGLAGGLGLRRRRLLVVQVARDVEALGDDEQQVQGGQAEHLEADPGRGGEGVGDVQVGDAGQGQEQDPGVAEPLPDRLGQLELLADQGTQQVLAEQLADHEHQRHRPADRARLPHDEVGVVEVDGQAAQDRRPARR